MTKITTLDELRSYLSGINYIGNGGCGIAALVMYQWLKKHKPNANVKIVYLYTDNCDYSDNSDTLKNKAKKYTACTHAGILYKGQVLDCNKVVQNQLYNHQHNLTDVNFVKQTLKKGHWNKSFNRRVYVPKIEKTTGIKLNLVD